jgi:lysophospholipase
LSVLGEERFSPPPGFLTDTFVNAAGRIIRYGHARPEGNPRGRCLIIGGFREPLEKYFELMREQLARGFEVYALDLPGQGGSARFLPEDPMRSHHSGYGESIATVDRFARDVMGPSELPTFILAHSMGAHVTLRYLKECKNDIAGAALTAPMIEFNAGLPDFLAKLLVTGARAFGALKRYVPFGGPWTEKSDVFAGNRKTSDPARFQVQSELYRNSPQLRMGDPVYGWVDESYKSVRDLNAQGYLEGIRTPVIMGIAGADTIVKSGACGRAARLLPNCTRVDIPGALHEIWMERDALRAPWRAAVDRFLERHMAAQTGPRGPGM